jgi:acetolactate decarboxylase
MTAVAAAGAPPAVLTFGTLREVVREGRIGGRVALSQVVARPHAWGLGALAQLRGEVAILDGTIWISTVEDSQLVTTASPAARDSACLLVAAHVPAWRDVRITAPIPLAALQDTLAARGAGLGLPRGGPFPFQVEGPLAGLEWHVIDARRLAPGPSSHEAHQEAAMRGRRDAVRGTLVGFYSDHHAGVFTHHTTHVHAHVVVAAESLSAHVDDVVVGAGAVLRLPAVGATPGR